MALEKFELFGVGIADSFASGESTVLTMQKEREKYEIDPFILQTDEVQTNKRLRAR